MAVVRRRYQLKSGGKRYDLTGEVFDLLSKKTFKLAFPSEWREQRRADGLEEKGLFILTVTTSRSKTYKRTELGDEIYKAFLDKGKTVSSKKAAKK